MKHFKSYLRFVKSYLAFEILPLPFLAVSLLILLTFSFYYYLGFLALFFLYLVFQDKKKRLGIYLILVLVVLLLSTYMGRKISCSLLFKDLEQIKIEEATCMNVYLYDDSYYTEKGYCLSKAIITKALGHESWVGKRLYVLGHYPLALRGQELSLSWQKLKVKSPDIEKGEEQAIVFIQEPSQVKLSKSDIWVNWRIKIKIHLEEFLSALSFPVRDLARALLWGDRNYLLREEKQLFFNLGLSHLLALSGFHLSLWSLVFLFIARIFFSRYINEILLPFFLVFYVILSGFSPSLVRAWFFVLVWSFYRSRFWQLEVWSVLSLVLILSLLFDPMLLNSLSFCLSFLAFAAILTQKESNAIFMPLRIFLMTGPLLLFYFPTISLSGLILTPLLSYFIMFFMWGLLGGYFIYHFFPSFLPLVNSFLNQTLFLMESILKKATPYAFPIGRNMYIALLVSILAFLFLRRWHNIVRVCKGRANSETYQLQ